MQAYLDTVSPSDLCSPLTFTADYCGVRLVVYAELPIDRSTIVYGSNNFGAAVHIDDAPVAAAMRKSANSLMLAPHDVVSEGDTLTRLFAAADVEVHKGQDSRIYLVNAARALPPCLSS